MSQERLLGEIFSCPLKDTRNQGYAVGQAVRSLKGELNRPGFLGGSNIGEDAAMKTSTNFSPEVRERAVRRVREHRGEPVSPWAAIGSLATQIGGTAETLRRWVRPAEKDRGERAGATSAERERIKELEREVRERRQAHEILRQASAYFARAELDRPFQR